MRTYAGHYLIPNNHNMRLFDSALPASKRSSSKAIGRLWPPVKAAAGWTAPLRKTGTADYWLATRCASECPSKPGARYGAGIV